MRETGRHGFQSHVIERLKLEFEGAFVIKNDAGLLQGIPDLLVLLGPRWAMLETKRGANAPKRPNQDYYVRKFGDMSYAAFINPENEEEIFDELHHALEPRRHPRFLKS